MHLDAEVVEDGKRAAVVLQLGLRVRHEAGQEALHLLVDFVVVDDDSLGPGVGEVADHPQGQRELGVERAGCPDLLLADLDLVPYRCQVTDVGLEIGLAGPLAGGADDEAEVPGPDPVHDLAQAPAFAIPVDPPRDAHARGPGREHQVPAGDRDVRGNARALAADRILGHLDDDLLPLCEQRVDPGRLAAVAVATAAPVATAAAAAPVTAAAARPGLFLGVDLGARGGLVEVVAHVEEGGLLEADVHEGRLHARQHTAHAAQRHHARHAAVALAFDVKLRELAHLHDRHAGLPGAGIDQDLVLRSGLPGAGIRRHAFRLRRWRAVSVNDRGWRPRKARAWRG